MAKQRVTKEQAAELKKLTQGCAITYMCGYLGPTVWKMEDVLREDFALAKVMAQRLKRLKGKEGR